MSSKKVKKGNALAVESNGEDNPRYTIGGHKLAPFCRALGAGGYSAAQCWQLMGELGLAGGKDGTEVDADSKLPGGGVVAWNTVMSQCGGGRQQAQAGYLSRSGVEIGAQGNHHAGELAEITDAQWSAVAKLIGDPAGLPDREKAKATKKKGKKKAKKAHKEAAVA